MKATWRAAGTKQISDVAFSAEWLSLREPADLAARNSTLLTRAAHCVAPGQCVLDLGSGTGATVRAFEAHGYTDLTWRLFDNDPALLDVAGALHPRAERITGNLADLNALPLDQVGLVTASALLDLMPLHWVKSLAARLFAARIPFYAALSYDGIMHWQPPLPADAEVTAHFNAHQHGDKGIGAALGPEAGETSRRIFDAQHFDVTTADSPWVIEPARAPLHEALLRGIAAAAAEAGCSEAPAWGAARIAAVETSRGVIGHTDLLAIPLGAAR
jgi:SAM-dependent methyltransferase